MKTKKLKKKVRDVMLSNEHSLRVVLGWSMNYRTLNPQYARLHVAQTVVFI